VAPRSYLYVPGHRPDRFDKALTSGADAVIFDLEDAVPVAAKDAARDDVRTQLAGLVHGGGEAWVRINDGDRGVADLAALAELSTLAGVVVPKARPDGLAALHAGAPHVAMVALIESASAVADVAEIAAVDGVRTLAMGEVDLAADLGLGDDVPDAAMWALRMPVVVACAARGRAAPLGPVVRDIDDLGRFEAIVRQLRSAGFGAVQAIHPKQVPIIDAVFTPTADELAAMERILQQAEAADGGVFVDDDGRMIDEAVLRSARRLLGRD
jgi:citrate lyase subunit beta / citryl-CoA lyase